MPGVSPAARLAAALLGLSGGAACGRAPPGPGADVVGELQALLAAGESHYQEGALDSAESGFSRALTLARERGDREGEAGVMVWLGTVAYRRADYRAARALLDQALDLQQRHGLTAHLWRTNNVLGLVAYYEGRYYDALERHGAAAELAAVAGDSVSLAKSWNNVALARIELGSYGEARDLMLRALPVARAAGETLVEGRVLVNLGMLAVRTGDLEAAVAHLEDARRPLAEVSDIYGEQNRLGQLGTLYASLGEPGRAIAYLDTALREARAQESPQEAASNLEQMGTVYRDAGDYARALRVFEEARVLNDTLGLEDEAAFDLRSMAEIHLELGNHDLARRSAVRALEIHRRLGNQLAVMHGSLLLARLAQVAGDRNERRARLDEAEHVSRVLGARAPRLAVALTTARLADADGDSPAVMQALGSVARDLAAGGTDVEWEAHWLAARAHARSGALAAAVASGRRAVAAVERVRGEFGSGMLRTRYQAAREEVYRDLVDALLRQERTEDAFEVADASRGRVLLEHLATVRTGDGSTARELAEEERQLLRQIDTLTTIIHRVQRGGAEGDSSAFRAELGRLQTDLERIRGEYTAALTLAEERHGASRALIGGSRPSAATVRAALHPGEALLEYYLLPDRVLLFVVRPGGTRVLSVPVERSALAARIRVVRGLTGRADRAGASGAALEALHETLIGVARRGDALAGSSTLVLVPHGELEYVPFAALREAATGRYLVEDFTLLHLPSAAALPALRARSSTEGASGGVVAFAPFPRELPGTVAETRALERAMPGTATRRGTAASEAALRSALADTDLVHVATHGVLNARNPLFSRVELAPGRGGDTEDDGRLEVHEVNRLRIGAPLVFLSGCETGLGASGSTGFSTGEDYATLTRAFLNAGAANVIATLWRVEDRGAAEFASRFYREVGLALARGGRDPRPLAEALNRVQREMLRDPGWAAPFYWAGYRLTGTGGPAAANPGRPVRS